MDARQGSMMATTMRLGVDVACRAAHRGSLADEAGEFAWSGRRFRTTPDELEQLWGLVPDDAEVTVVMEPTRNAWVPLAAWFQARGAKVVLVPPEQSSDLRDYYSKHTKNDRLDSRVLARLPMLHPEGLTTVDSLGPAEPLKRAVRHRRKLVQRRTACFQRIDALVELLGPAWAETLGTGSYGKAALAVLARYADPHKLKRLGPKRLTDYLVRHSGGAWREQKAEALRAAADQTLQLWDHGGLDFDELAADIAAEVRIAQQLTEEIEACEDRIEPLYETADPAGLLLTVPGLATISAATILGLLGDPNRFGSLAGIRSYTGMVPKVDQSGTAERHAGITKAGDPQLRETLFLAAERARLIDPDLAAHYHRLVAERDKHHVSAICRLATKLVTRIAACWRNGEPYRITDADGTPIDEATGRQICRRDWRVTAADRRSNRWVRAAQHHKNRTGRRDQESTEKAAPAVDPPHDQPTSNDLDDVA